jgi:hypothetical protein
MNAYLNNKLNRHQQLIRKVDEEERMKMEARLRIKNVYSRRSSNESEETKRIFDLPGIDRERIEHGT